MAILGARIEGDLDLAQTHVRSTAFQLEGSWVTGGVLLSDTRLDGLLSLNGTLIEGRLDGWRAIIGSNLIMQGAVFGGPVNLRSQNVSLPMDLEDVSTADQQAFDATRLHVGRDGLYLRKARFGGPVYLFDAQIDGQMSMEGAQVAYELDAEPLRVGAAGLLLSDAIFSGTVSLGNALSYARAIESNWSNCAVGMARRCHHG